MKVLHVIATPNGERSTSMSVSNEFLGSLQGKHADLTIETINLFETQLPPAGGALMAAKWAPITGQEVTDEQKAEFKPIVDIVNQFLAADLVVITSPMWNFGVPYVLKHYIDTIVQPGHTFKYTESGPVGIVPEGKKAVIIASRGGDYSAGGPYEQADFQAPYLRAILGFLGVTDVNFVIAQPLDMGPEPREAALAKAKEEVNSLADSI